MSHGARSAHEFPNLLAWASIVLDANCAVRAHVETFRHGRSFDLVQGLDGWEGTRRRRDGPKEWRVRTPGCFLLRLAAFCLHRRSDRSQKLHRTQVVHRELVRIKSNNYSRIWYAQLHRKWEIVTSSWYLASLATVWIIYSLPERWPGSNKLSVEDVLCFNGSSQLLRWHHTLVPSARSLHAHFALILNRWHVVRISWVMKCKLYSLWSCTVRNVT